MLLLRQFLPTFIHKLLQSTPDAMRFVFERLKVVVDSNSAACVAALFSNAFTKLCQEKDYR